MDVRYFHQAWFRVLLLVMFICDLLSSRVFLEVCHGTLALDKVCFLSDLLLALLGVTFLFFNFIFRTFWL